VIGYRLQRTGYKEQGTGTASGFQEQVMGNKEQRTRLAVPYKI